VNEVSSKDGTRIRRPGHDVDITVLAPVVADFFNG
jgi:hypothetical protein